MPVPTRTLEGIVIASITIGGIAATVKNAREAFDAHTHNLLVAHIGAHNLAKNGGLDHQFKQQARMAVFPILDQKVMERDSSIIIHTHKFGGMVLKKALPNPSGTYFRVETEDGQKLLQCRTSRDLAVDTENPFTINKAQIANVATSCRDVALPLAGEETNKVSVKTGILISLRDELAKAVAFGGQAENDTLRISITGNPYELRHPVSFTPKQNPAVFVGNGNIQLCSLKFAAAEVIERNGGWWPVRTYADTTSNAPVFSVSICKPLPQANLVLN